MTCLVGRALDSKADPEWLWKGRRVLMEVWTHLLAYNLIRTVMAQAADRHRIEPRSLSFKGTLQTLEAFRPLIDFQGHRGREFRSHL